MILRLVAYYVVFFFFIVLLARLVFDWIQVFARDWKPSGIVLVAAEAVYTVTDPPLRAIRKVIPPLRLGQVQLDLGFMILAFGCVILMGVLG